MTRAGNPRLSQFLSEELRYLVLAFDEHNQLISSEGNAAFYGFDTNSISGKSADDFLPFLTGIDKKVTQHLPYIEFIDNIITDIYLYPDASGYEVVLLETSAQHDAQRSVQQQSNENAILHYRLQQLSERLKQNNILLEKANQAKSEFIATASHELKTPLASILGYAESLDKYRDNPELEQAFTAISGNGNYLLSLIDNLLEQGRVESDQVSIQRRPSKLGVLLDDIENIIRPLANKKKLSFKVESSHNELFLLLDEQHVRQILINLMTNAVKYTEEGQVILKADYSDGLLQFRIVDTGIGIPESELEEIMLPFRRVGGHRNSIEGIGLGLSVSHKLATLMDAELLIESKPGQGTTAQLTIPAEKSTINKTGLSDYNRNAHILLVEDDSDLSSLFEKVLSEYGYKAITVSDQESLDQALNTHQPEIILMDHNVNGHNGLDLVQHIYKNDYPGKVIMMTASSDQSLVDMALQAGCSDFLQKPINLNTLIGTIQQYL